MNTFDRHLLREWLQILGLWLALTCGLLFVQICYDDFRTLREQGAGGSDIWLYCLVTMPGFLAIVLPSALLVSLLFTLAKLHRANELTAMRAAGVGYARMMAPVWMIGVLACGVAWWLNSVVVPWSVEQSRAQKEELQFRGQAKVLPPDRVGASFNVGFDNRADGRLWFLNRYSSFTDHAYGISVSQLDAARREATRVVAFTASSGTGTTSPTTTTVRTGTTPVTGGITTASGGGGISTGAIVAIIVIAGVLLGSAWQLVRRRRRGGSAGGAQQDRTEA